MPRDRLKLKRSVLVALLALLPLAACGDDDDGGGDDTSGGGEFVPEERSGVAGALLPEERDLWVYDAASATFEVVEGDASSYEVDLREPAEPVTIGYQDPWATNPFAIPIRERFLEAADELGIEVIECDSAFEPDKAVSCAELLAQQDPAFVVAGNWQTGVSEAMMKIYDDAQIPTVSIDVVQPNSIFFGADNYTSGVIGGRAAGEYAKEQWDCEDVWVFLGEDLSAGEAPDLRLIGFADGVQEVCGAISSDRIQRQPMTEGTGDQALTVTTDWLTAHPDAEHVLATTLDDERSSGIAKAFKAQGGDSQVVGLGCDTVGIEVVKDAPASENNYLGCVAYYPEKYADYLMSLALDVLEGKPVPNEVHLEHDFLTNDNIGDVY